MAVSRNNKRSAIRRNGRGMTLVELIVVLAILAILSSAGIGAAVGYMKRSTIETNQSNAETIYQAAQTALQQMQKAGGVFSTETGSVVTINDWVTDLIGTGKAYAWVDSNLSPDMQENADYYRTRYTDEENVFSEFELNSPDANESVHMRYVLKYTKNGANNPESKIIKNLLQPYFSDASVFQGTMVLEFDVEKSADAYGGIHLTAKCLSVFYDSRAKGGWGANAGGDTFVPKRDSSYRAKTSLIGYYDGYKGTAVDTVYLPKVQEGIVVKKFTTEYEPVMPSLTPTGDPDPGATTTTPTPEPTPVIHTRLTWAATLDKENLVGSAKDVYYKIALMNGDTVVQYLILNEDFLLQDDPIDGNMHKYDYFSDFANGGTKVGENTYVHEKKVTEESYTAVYSDNVWSTVKKLSIEVTANVYVTSIPDDDYNNKNTEGIIGQRKLMSLRITYVSGELDYKSDTEYSTKAAYLEYSLDLKGGDDNSNLYTVPTNDLTKAVITVYPNYFNPSLNMNGVNDDTGIIPFKKGKITDIEQAAVQGTTQSET